MKTPALFAYVLVVLLSACSQQKRNSSDSLEKKIESTMKNATESVSSYKERSGNNGLEQLYSKLCDSIPQLSQLETDIEQHLDDVNNAHTEFQQSKNIATTFYDQATSCAASIKNEGTRKRLHDLIEEHKKTHERRVASADSACTHMWQNKDELVDERSVLKIIRTMAFLEAHQDDYNKHQVAMKSISDKLKSLQARVQKAQNQ